MTAIPPPHPPPPPVDSSHVDSGLNLSTTETGSPRSIPKYENNLMTIASCYSDWLKVTTGHKIWSVWRVSDLLQQVFQFI